MFINIYIYVPFCSALTVSITGQLAIPSGPNMVPNGAAAAGLKVCHPSFTFRTFNYVTGHSIIYYYVCFMYVDHIEWTSIHDTHTSQW